MIKQKRDARRLRNAALLIIAAAITAVVSGCGPKSAFAPLSSPVRTSTARPVGKTLSLTIVPYEGVDKLTEEYSPMAAYLAHRMGVTTGTFVSVVDYAGVLAALESGQVDVAYLSPLPYAIATNRMKIIPLSMPIIKGKLTYHGIIFVRADSPIKTIADLKGRRMAFGDPTSTSGYLLPMRVLEQNGVPITALKQSYNAGDANVVVKAVENGAADAGAAYENVFEVAYRGHPEKATAMRIIGTTEEIPNGIYVGRGNLSNSDVAKLKKAFLDMNTDPEGRAAMLKAPHDKMVPPDDKMFDGVREKAKSLNLDLTSLDKKKK